MVKYPEIVSQLPSGLDRGGSGSTIRAPSRHYQHWLGPLAAQHIPHMIASGVTCWNQVHAHYARASRTSTHSWLRAEVGSHGPDEHSLD